MTENELKTLNINNTAIIEKKAKGYWVCWNKDYLNGYTRKSQYYVDVLEAAQKQNPFLIVEKTNESYKLLYSALNRNYLKGVQFGVIVAHTAFEDFGSNSMARRLSNALGRVTNCVREDCADLINAASFPAELSQVPAIINTYNPTGRIESPEVYNLEEIKSLSPRYAIITDTGKKEGRYYGIINSQAKPTEGNKEHHRGETVTSLLKTLAAQNCSLVVEKVKANKYKLVYSDLQKNFVRGQLAVGTILENAYKEKVLSDKYLKLKINRELRKIIRGAQREVKLPQFDVKKDVLTELNFDIPWDYTAINQPPEREL